jgi:ComF family protein
VARNNQSTYLQHNKYNMGLLEKIIAKLAPYQCLGCGLTGNILCDGCLQLFSDLVDRCGKCRQTSLANLTCRSCQQNFPLVRAVAVTDYEGVAKDLVWQLKFGGVRSAAKLMASCMEPLLGALARPESIIVPVPTAAARVRQRGYDQAKLLAHELAEKSNVPYAEVLMRLGHTQQVGAERSLRLQQLKGAFRVTKNVRGTHIILIDDITTTGATLGSAAKILIEAGATSVQAITFAQA